MAFLPSLDGLDSAKTMYPHYDARAGTAGGCTVLVVNFFGPSAKANVASVEGPEASPKNDSMLAWCSSVE